MYFLWDSSNFFLKNRVDIVTRLSHGREKMKNLITQHTFIPIFAYIRVIDQHKDRPILGQLGLAQKYTALFYICHRNCQAPNLILTPCQRHPLSRHCSIHIGSNRAVHSIVFAI